VSFTLLVGAHEDVRGLEIAVDEPLGVGRLQGREQVADDGHDTRRGDALARENTACRVGQGTSSITRNIRPSSARPKSVTSTMPGWRMRLAARPSRSSMAAASGTEATLGCRTLSATSFSSASCWAQ
jgi:hypothetical protein